MTEKSFRKALLGLLFWTAVALFFSTQGYLGRGGGWEALETSLRRSLPQWYLWGLLSPFVFRADRWVKSRSPDLRGRVLRHVPLAVGFVSLYVVLRTAVDGALGNFPAVWNFTGLAPQYHWNFLIYSVLVGIGIAYDLESEARERELRASQLEARLAEARLETLKAQLRPHFLFNTLNAISAFVEKDPKTARRMTAHLGDLLRHSLESADRREVPLAEELATVDDYLAIQQIRFAGKLSVDHEVAPETLGASVPGFLLQPLVENAVEHGLVGKSEPGSILLRAERRDSSLRLTVKDDGVGLPPSWNGNGSGSGLKNVRERLRALYGDEARLDIANGVGAGVTVTVSLPFERMDKIRTFVVDDEPPARRRLLELLEPEPDIEIAGAFAGAVEALEAMKREAPDLLFLDVQMPGLGGFEFLDGVVPCRPPITIFVTAYDAYAVRAFEVRALDYLLKPFSDERFDATLARARERVRSREREALGEKLLSLVDSRPASEAKQYASRLVVRNRGQIRFLDVGDVEWIEATGVYATIHEGGRGHLVRESLAALEARLDPSRFARIHRSAIVALDRVAELRITGGGSCRVVLRDGATLPVSRRQREALEKRLTGERR